MSFDLSAKEFYVKIIEERGDKRTTLKHFFRFPTTEDWLNYFRASSQVGLSKGRDTVELTGENQERDQALYDEFAIRVEGYKLHGVDIMTLPNWKELIPLPHKLNAIAGVLFFVRIGSSATGEFEETQELDLGETSIELRFEALQNGMAKQLVFSFSNPDPSDYLKFSRMNARMQLVRTKQRGVSAIKVPGNIHPMIDLFDKLIQKVEGYEYEGKDLMADSDWKPKIDIYHKREAVRELFGTTVQEEEEKNA